MSVSTANYYTFAKSQIGQNHKKMGRPCQDYAGYSSSNDCLIIGVADGHGSANSPRSQQGARQAVLIALETISNFVTSFTAFLANRLAQDASQTTANYLENNKSALATQIATQIVRQWRAWVDQDVQNQPFSEEELAGVKESHKVKLLQGQANPAAYGTTLLVACITPDYWFALQVGDGTCVVINRQGECQEPLPQDELCQFNVTTSLCDDTVLNEFRSYFSTDFPLAIFLGCDGVDNSFENTAALHVLYRSLLANYCSSAASEAFLHQVIEDLSNITEQGSGDDVSIAGLLCKGLSNEFAQRLDTLNCRDTAANEIAAKQLEITVMQGQEQRNSRIMQNAEVNQPEIAALLANLERFLDKAIDQEELAHSAFSQLELAFCVEETRERHRKDAELFLQKAIEQEEQVIRLRSQAAATRQRCQNSLAALKKRLADSTRQLAAAKSMYKTALEQLGECSESGSLLDSEYQLSF